MSVLKFMTGSQPKLAVDVIVGQKIASRIPRCISAFSVVVVSLLITAAVFEIGSRLFFYIHWGGHLYRTQHNEYSLRLGWVLAPGIYRFFEINDQGFRRPQPVPVDPGPQTLRIFLIGGSTAFGSNGLYRQVDPKPLLYAATIDYQLQAMLQAQYPDQRVEVINAGVPEYRLFQEITLFREKLINFRPDLVIFLDGHNDISALTEGNALARDPQPYWGNRHFVRGQRALNEQGTGTFYYVDILLGRSSYFYYGLSVLHQRLHEAFARQQAHVFPVAVKWGAEAFRPDEEAALRRKYHDNLKELDQALPFYLDFVQDLKAMAELHQVKVVYALQPQIVVEDPRDLSERDREIQRIAFEHQRDLGTLSWRYLTANIGRRLEEWEDDNFRFANLVRIGSAGSKSLYTDYCHLTSEGNREVATRLSPLVIAMLHLDADRAGDQTQSRLPDREFLR